MALSQEYAVILNDLNRDVLRSKPADPLQFCANWFNSRLEEQRKATLRGTTPNPGSVPPEVAMANATSSPSPAPMAGEPSVPGTFSSVNPFGAAPTTARSAPFAAPDEDDEPAFAPPPPTFALGRRTSVSAESLAPGGSAAEEIKKSAKTVIPKTPEQLARIARATEGNLLFRHLEEDQYKDVLLAMKEVQVDAGTAVIEQGAQGDYFYVVESGTLDVYIRPTGASRSASIASASTDDGPRTDTTSHLGEKKVSYGPSSSFGELALLYLQPRAATVLSTSPCILWALDRVTFRSILMETNSRKREMYDAFIKEVPLFEHLSPSERAKISDVLEVKTFEPGQEIVRQGERGTEFYVVIEGEAVVRKKTADFDEEVVGKLRKGDYFGELALLNKAPRAATIAATAQKVRVATLSEQAFTRLLGPLAGIMDRHARETYGSAALLNAGPTVNAGTGLAGNDFSEIDPHGQAPLGGGQSAQSGGGTWIGGIGTSPFGGLSSRA